MTIPANSPLLVFQDSKNAVQRALMDYLNNTPPMSVSLFRLAFRLALVVLVVLVVLWTLEWVMVETERAEQTGLMIGLLTALLIVYVLLMAIPFVPGIEIGVTLLILKGASIAPIVYFATVAGLVLAYLAGRFLPYSWLHATLADLRMRRACGLVERIAPMSRAERMEHLLARLPRRARPYVSSGRYLLIALLLNIPGNAAIGGGGGIMFAAGLTRIYKPWLTLLTVALAVLPVPLSVWLYGSDWLSAR